MNKEPSKNASLKTRLFAFLLDYLLIILYGVLVIGTVSVFFRPLMTSLFTESVVTAQLTGFLMMTLPVSLYFIIGECSKRQGTWGKQKVGIRVVDRQGNRIGFVRSVLRTGVKFLPWELAHFGVYRLMLPTILSDSTVLIILTSVNVAILIYVLMPLTNPSRKSVYDFVAGTEVVRS
ncbi:RDD family protein [Ornithinibacillus sp. L9]|uniref:RDD family protein n=1 Tax=Ornithinibacillus caprae TaxID=2678566 RepID=A0A6N8FP59_9BACI|nr:RDD family protein [Ornithinibacillus caprae]MUK89238.1 RDD family protein [Ornithinibacillus caprae]